MAATLNEAFVDNVAAFGATQEGIVWWTGNAQMRNELGNVHMQLGSLNSARESYEASAARVA